MGNQPNKLKPIFLIIGLVLVLGGGGFAIWMVMKKEEEPTETTTTNTQEQAPVGGRRNVTGIVDPEDLQHSSLSTSKDNKDRERPTYEAVLATSPEGQQLIEDRVKKIQLHSLDADTVRARYNIGRGLTDVSAFSTKAVADIGKMFALVPGVIQGDPLTYPVYGKYESKGEMLRADLEEFLNKDWSGYNLTEKRHGGNAWWLDSVGLNLMYGNQNAYVHTADQIWWYKADRAGLDFYKVLNGHDVSDRRLLEKKHWKGIFNAGGAYKLAEIWLREMDKFDKVTREEAKDALELEGKIRLL